LYYFTISLTVTCINTCVSTADIARRRFDQHHRVLELLKATRHISPIDDIDDDEWGQVKRYYQQYGDVDGGGTSYSMALRMNHDFHSDSIIDFILPKISLLVLGIAASIAAAASRFPMSESSSMSEREELNPDRLGSASKVYVISSFVQIIVQIIVCLFILYTSFVTGERLKREPFLSTRPAQLAFRVSLFSFESPVLFSNVIAKSDFLLFASHQTHSMRRCVNASFNDGGTRNDAC